MKPSVSQNTPGSMRDPVIHGLYFHVPFCFHKCHYCDFYSLVDGENQDRREAFVAALLREFQLKQQCYQLRPKTLFFGGGTPSLLTSSQWQRMADAIGQMPWSHSVLEWSVEANPETVTPELARIWAAGGVNRVSLGAQSFDPVALKTLERWHDPDNVARSISILRAAGITNLNLDLIFAIPGQTRDGLRRDLETALALQPSHLSVYSLIFEPRTPLTVKRRMGLIQPAPESLEQAMFEQVITTLQSAGYEHYEVSNFAKVNASNLSTPNQCLHNLLYWRNDNWLGIGPSAASHVAGRRWKNEPHLGHYLRDAPSPAVVDEELLAPARRVGEAMMMRLRLIHEGLALTWLQENLAMDDARWDELARMSDEGWLVRDDQRYRLSQRGLMVADHLAAQLL